MKTGWICPVCGKGVAPWMENCECIDTSSWVYPQEPFSLTYGCSMCGFSPCQCSTTTIRL